MTDTATPSMHHAAAERLLSSLAGVVSARLVADAQGRLVEIHVLATPALNPKQVARNVQSALSAGAGIDIDHRIISIAQVRAEAPLDALAEVITTPKPALPATNGAAAHAAAPSASGGAVLAEVPEPTPQRPVFVGLEVSVDANRYATCMVTLRWGPDEFTGRGTGFDTPTGRAEAAARAVFDAYGAFRGTDRLGLEGVALSEVHGQSVVIVSARAHDGRRRVPLTGAARLHHSPEEAAVLAALQATNYWRAQP
jgi:hypothetical protein